VVRIEDALAGCLGGRSAGWDYCELMPCWTALQVRETNRVAVGTSLPLSISAPSVKPAASAP
jgi:hypothetical protein